MEEPRRGYIGNVLKESEGKSKGKGGRPQPQVPAAEQEKLQKPAWKRTALFGT